MTLLYTDAEGDTQSVKTRVVSGEHVPSHDVAALPGTVEADIGASKGFLQTLAGMIAAGRAAVDLSSTVNGYLSALAGAISSARMQVDLTATINGYLASLASAVLTGSRLAVTVDATAQANLATLAAASALPGAVYMSKKKVSSAGTPVALGSSQALLNGVWVKAEAANTGVIYVGSPTSLSSANGYPLLKGESVFVKVANLASVFIDSSISNEGVNYIGS